MNGSKIALVLGLAGLAGLGLATPGMLGAGAQPEPAPVPLPSAALSAPAGLAPASCALEPASVRLEALVPECTSDASAVQTAPSTRVAQEASPEPAPQLPVQGLRRGTLIRAVECPGDAQVVDAQIRADSRSLKNAAAIERSQLAMKQRRALGKQLAAGKALPSAQSVKPEALLAAQRVRAGSSPELSDSRDATSGPVRPENMRPEELKAAARARAEKLQPPK